MNLFIHIHRRQSFTPLSYIFLHFTVEEQLQAVSWQMLVPVPSCSTGKPAWHCCPGRVSNTPWILCNLNAKTEICPSICKQEPRGRNTENKPNILSSVKRFWKICHRQNLTSLLYKMFGFSVKSDIGALCLHFFLETEWETSGGLKPGILLSWINLALTICLYSCHLCPLSYSLLWSVGVSHAYVGWQPGKGHTLWEKIL